MAIDTPSAGARNPLDPGHGPNETLSRGLALHHAGKFEEAAALYRRVLERDPAQTDALTHLGLVQLRQGRLEEAVRSFDASLAIKPGQATALNNRGTALHLLKRNEAAVESFDRAIEQASGYAQAHCNRGLALMALSRHAEALAGFDEAIRLKPDYAQAHNERGHALAALGRQGEARKSFRKALALKPDLADSLYNKGNHFFAQRNHVEALRCYDRALALAPNNAAAHFNRGNALRGLDRQAEALEAFDRAIAAKPDYSKAYNNRGNALQALKRRREALASFEKAIAVDPANAHAYNNRALALQVFHRYEESLASFDRSLALEPDRIDALNNRGNLLIVMGRPAEAEACFDRAIALAPENPKGYWNKSLLLLLYGRYREAWPLYEWRRRNPSLPISKRRSDTPLWLGAEPIEGKTILLHAEQGIGDTIQFCRYVEHVARRGASIVLEVHAPLVPLLARLDGVTSIVASGDAPPPHDIQTSLASLPLAFDTALDTIPARVPYLSVEPAAVSRWRAALGAPRGFRAGLVWSGDPIHKNDHNRSIPLEALLPLTRCGAEIVGLQKEPRPADLAVLERTPAIRNLAGAFESFVDAAAVVAQLDLVISADTSVAHLAGALGKPVWILLPHAPDWRWLLEREDSPWYPSATLFRQSAPGDWAAAVARAAARLEERARQPAPPGGGAAPAG